MAQAAAYLLDSRELDLYWSVLVGLVGWESCPPKLPKINYFMFYFSSKIGFNKTMDNKILIMDYRISFFLSFMPVLRTQAGGWNIQFPFVHIRRAGVFTHRRNLWTDIQSYSSRL